MFSCHALCPSNKKIKDSDSVDSKWKNRYRFLWMIFEIMDDIVRTTEDLKNKTEHAIHSYAAGKCNVLLSMLRNAEQYQEMLSDLTKYSPIPQKRI